MRILFTLLVLGLLFAFALILLRTWRSPRSAAAPSHGPGVWRTHHYDAKGTTRVVVQKVSAGGANILDEHLVSTIALDDPEYDAAFLAAMSTARERRAMFESEQDS